MALGMRTQSVPAATFHDFPRLPLELRIMVWKFTARQVRVVEFEKLEAEFNGIGKIHRFTSKTPVPGILHASAEAREIGLKRYERLVFSGIFTGSYINWNVDYLGHRGIGMWSSTSYGRSFCPWSDSERTSVVRRCRRLAIVDPSSKNDLRYHIKFTVRGFTNLKEVLFLFPGDVDNYTQGSGNLTLSPISATKQVNQQSWIRKYTGTRYLSRIKSKTPKLKRLIAMQCDREPERLLNLPEDTGRGFLHHDEALLAGKPELPKRGSFKSYRLPELRSAAQDLNISDKGHKKDLMTRLDVAKHTLFAEEMRGYQQAMVEYSAAVKKLLAYPLKPRQVTYSKSTEEQLRISAEEKGLDTNGSREELVGRLRAWHKPRYEASRKAWREESSKHWAMMCRSHSFEWF